MIIIIVMPTSSAWLVSPEMFTSLWKVLLMDFGLCTCHYKQGDGQLLTIKGDSAGL